MKKSILYSCVAVIALTAGTAQAQVIATTPSAQQGTTTTEISAPVPTLKVTANKPSADEIKTAYIQMMLTTSPAAGLLYDLENMTATADGDNFTLTVKGIPQKLQSKEAGSEAKIITPPDLTIPLIYDGEFNGKAQYQIGDTWNNIMSIIKTFFPEAIIGAEKAEVKSTWVPAYQLRPQTSVNVQNWQINIPNEAKATIDSLVSDTLSRVVDGDKMDVATVADVKNLIVRKQDTMVSIPKMTINQQMNGSPITGDPVAQLFDSKGTTFGFDVPAIVAMTVGNPEPLLTMALKGNGSFEKGNFKYNGTIDNIHLGQELPIPDLYIPTTATVNFEIDNFTREFYEQVNAMNTNPKNSEELTQKMGTMVKDMVFKINQIEVKNAQVGLSLSGVSRAEKVQDDQYVPTFDGEIVITNLDTISPLPKVDEVACQNAKNNTASMDKETADQMVAMACTPRGGVLDIIRPYLKSDNRSTAADGTVTDKITIKFDSQGLQLNGIQVQ